MILSSETAASDADQMLAFYKQHFAVVELVSCSNCGAYLAFECSGGDGMGLQPNELGKYIIPIGDALQSSRVRLDEAPTGERMMGYQCGALVPNPGYPAAVRAHEAELAAYDKQHAKVLKEYEKNLEKAKKTGDQEKIQAAFQPHTVVYNPPQLTEPEKIECGNDTRLAEVERGKIPVGTMQSTMSPFQKHRIREEIAADKSYRPDFKKIGNIKHFESFQVERV